VAVVTFSALHVGPLLLLGCAVWFVVGWFFGARRLAAVTKERDEYLERYAGRVALDQERRAS
jgi:hypothetical protein